MRTGQGKLVAKPLPEEEKGASILTLENRDTLAFTPTVAHYESALLENYFVR